MHVIRLCSGGGGVEPASGEGVKGGQPRRDGPFQCQFTAIPAVKNEREKVSTSHFLPQIFQFNSIGPFNTLFMTHRKLSPYCIMGSGGEIKTLIL